MADMVLRKRAATRAGEIGLFLDTEVFQTEFDSIKSGVDVQAKITQSRSLAQMRYFWALARKISDSGAVGDLDLRDTMSYLLMKAKHVRYVTTTFRDGITETVAVPKSIRFASMDQTAFQRLVNRVIFIVTSEIIPDLPETELRAEIEKMAGIETPEAEPPKQRQRRSRPADPKPVSVIPDAHHPGEPAPSQSPDAPAPAPPAPSPPPAANAAGQAPTPPEPPPAAATPRNVAEWKAHAKAWLDAASDDPAVTDQDMMIKWNAEQKMRNACGVTADDRQKTFEYYTAILEAKRGAEAKRP